MSTPERRPLVFTERTIIPRPRKVAVRTVGRTREITGRLAAGEAAQLLHDRRKQVYENPDAVYTGVETLRLPPVGPERDALVEKLKALKAAGATHLAAGVELDIDTAQVAMLCKKHGIASARGRRGGREKE